MSIIEINDVINEDNDDLVYIQKQNDVNSWEVGTQGTRMPERSLEQS